ncbi:TLR13 [Mytilus coruscus]|uniref:TLR13 n=1 Tax=Mytilus coruscus TaxID=42192 RepID=A0A6J8CEC8_MYTCO|nr:TLR13 [Mytilus coruscus]
MNNVYLGPALFPWKDVNILLLDTPIRELHITNNDSCFDRRFSLPKESFIPAPVSLELLDLSNNGIDQIRLNLTYVLLLNLSEVDFTSYIIKQNLRTGFGLKKQSENKLDYIYDAFVSYSDEDRAFVMNECIKNLEHDGNLKLCLHHRDFIPGEDITDNIIHAIESSRKTICIITRSFLQSYYCMFEYNMARMENIHSRNGKNVLFLVFYEQLLPEELPLVLYEVIQKQTYIEFPNDEHRNRIFWEK